MPSWFSRIFRRKPFASGEGYAIYSAGRDSFSYEESGRSVRVNLEMLSGPVHWMIFPASIRFWDLPEEEAPYSERDKENPISDEDRERIIARLTSYFDSKGQKYIIKGR